MTTIRQNRQRETGETRERLILESLAAEPKTAAQLCEALDMKHSNLTVYIRRLRAARRVFVCDHDRRKGDHAGRPAPIFAAGSEPDVEFVPQSCPRPKIIADQRRQRVLELLVEKPRTRQELADCMFLCVEAAGKYVTEMRRPENRRLYIIDWRHPSKVHNSTAGGDWTPVYAVGTKPDKIKPVEGKKARHARLQRIPEYREGRNLKRKARYAVEKATKKKQGIFAALGL